MTAEQKAKELIEQFMPLVESFSYQQRIENAKKCALIVAKSVFHSCVSEEDNYWLEVIDILRSYKL
jgi:hypothetical protein